MNKIFLKRIEDGDNHYKIKSNRESGNGRYDICLIPRAVIYPGVILELKSETYNNMNKGIKKKREIERCLKIKLILFFIISLILMLFFWYFISCFCAVYKNTQIHLIKDTLISFSLSLFYPIFLCLIPGIFRIPALRAPKQNKEFMYKFSKIIQLLQK